MLRTFCFCFSLPFPHVFPVPPRVSVSCMVCLLCHGPRAQRSSRNMQAAGSGPGLLSNVVEGDCTSRARGPALPCATRTEPRESDFSGYPRWTFVLNISNHLARAPRASPLRRTRGLATRRILTLERAGETKLNKLWWNL